jgi:hypothetical protein
MNIFCDRVELLLQLVDTTTVPTPLLLVFSSSCMPRAEVSNVYARRCTVPLLYCATPVVQARGLDFKTYAPNVRFHFPVFAAAGK